MKKILSLLSVLLISACSDDGAPDGFKIIDGFKSGGMPITSTMQLPAEIREKRNYPNVYQDNIGFIVATPARIPIIEKKGIELSPNCKSKETSSACLDEYKMMLEFYSQENMRLFTCKTKELCNEVITYFEKNLYFTVQKETDHENQGVYTAKSGKAFVVIQGFYLPDEYIKPIRDVLQNF